MATYTVYRPGPTITEDHDSFDEAYEALLGDTFAEIIGSIGGSPSLTWYLGSITSGGGAQPFWALNYFSTTGGHQAVYVIRWNPVLLGTLDPSIPFGGDHRWPQHVLDIPYSALSDWITRANIATVQACVGSNWASAMGQMAASVGACVGTATPLAYTDGARTGGRFGFRAIFTYNPSSSEISAGIKQLDATRLGIVTDADDGTLNVASGSAVFGESVSSVPVLTFQGGDSYQAWVDFTANQTTIAQDFSVTSINIVTNNGDLGVPSPPSNEPAPIDVSVQAFGSPGSVPAIIANTLPIGSLTTAISLGFGAIAVLGTVFQRLIPFVDQVVAVGSQIAGAPNRVANALESLLTAVESIATDLSAIRTALLPPDPDAPPSGSLVARVKELKDAMQAVADTRNTLRLKTHGVEVQAESGALIDE